MQGQGSCTHTHTHTHESVNGAQYNWYAADICGLPKNVSSHHVLLLLCADCSRVHMRPACDATETAASPPAGVVALHRCRVKTQSGATASYLSLVQQSCSSQLTLNAALNISVGSNVEPEGAEAEEEAQSNDADVSACGQACRKMCLVHKSGNSARQLVEATAYTMHNCA